MSTSPNDGFTKQLFVAAEQRLKQLSQLLSLQVLADLPDRLRNFWQALLGSYWFIPTACVILGILLAPLLVTIDQSFDREAVRDITFAFTGNGDAARAIMTSIAGAVLGVAGTTFSITIAVLSMASSQFGPRLLRNFLTDTPNQFVLGAFIGTFSYSLLVLKSIHEFDVAVGVPQLAVTFAIIMAIICALLLVYFIQRMVHAIQASHVIQNASNDAMNNINHWYSDHCGVQHQRDIEQNDVEQFRTWLAMPIYPSQSGYLQQIYFESLVTLTQDYGGVIHMHSRLGHYVTDNSVIGYFYQRPADHPSNKDRTGTPDLSTLPRSPDGMFWQRLADCIPIEKRSSPSNDIAYSLGQMTEIAVRALSPGINDPKTAINCVQSLTSCLSVMMRSQSPSPYHFYTPTEDDDSDESVVERQRVAILAVVTNPPNISEFINTSIGEVRRYAAADLMVLKELCQAVVNLNYAKVNDTQQQTLLNELKLIKRAGEENLSYQELKDDLIAMCEEAKHFILDENSQHQHFNYVREFSTNTRQALPATTK